MLISGDGSITLTNLTGAANGQLLTIFSVLGVTLPDSVDQTQGNFFLAGDVTLDTRGLILTGMRGGGMDRGVAQR